MLLIVVPAGAVAHEGHRHTILGRMEPERLPETSVWDHVLSALHDLTGGRTDPRHPEVHSFVAGNLFLSESDTATLLAEVATARARLQRLERELDQVSAGRNRDAIRSQIEQLPLEARDQILRRLSPRGGKALLRWVAIIKQGMAHGADQ